MIQTIEFHGHTVVAPIVGRGREMVAALAEYLPHPEYENPDLYFETDEQERKNFVRERDRHRCLLCSAEVETNEVHEIIPKGGASAPRALVPWNMICVCREHHDLLQRGVYKVYHFDPLDLEDGLVVLDAESRVIPKDQMWFYNRPDPEMAEKCHEDYRWLTEYARQQRGAKWEAATRLIRLKENEAYRHLGEKTHRSLVAGSGADPSECDKLEKAMRLAIEREAQDLAIQCEPDRALAVLRSIPDEDLQRALVDVSGMSKADYIEWYNENVKKDRRKKRWGFTKGGLFSYEIEDADPHVDEYEDIIEGGRLVKGEAKEVA